MVGVVAGLAYVVGMAVLALDLPAYPWARRSAARTAGSSPTGTTTALPETSLAVLVGRLWLGVLLAVTALLLVLVGTVSALVGPGATPFVPGRTVDSPVPGHHVTYPFGVRNAAYRAGFHTGADYAAPAGTSIVAVVGGTVIRADWGGAYGNWTLVQGDDGHVWLYAHQSRRVVRFGDEVRAGQLIGYVGETGNAHGPHLHLEKSRGSTWVYGQVVDPTW